MSDIAWASEGSYAAVADHIARVVALGRAHIAVPGGQTPLPIFQVLAARHDLPWRETRVTLVDDRLVPADHPCSNLALVKSGLSATGALIEPLVEGPGPGLLDLIWLGMGPDGHVASVFPSTRDGFSHQPAIVRTRPDPLPAEAPFERLTMTLGALCECKEMIFVVRGSAKLGVLRSAITGENDLPVARLLKLYRGAVTVYWEQ
jgi:6-phosphogluconolactonase